MSVILLSLLVNFSTSILGLLLCLLVNKIIKNQKEFQKWSGKIQKILKGSITFYSVIEKSNMFQKILQCSKRFDNDQKGSKMFKILEYSRRLYNV